MTNRTLERSLVLGIGLGLLACGVPKEYIADRDHLNLAIEAFDKASREVSRAGGGAAGPARMTPTLRDSLVKILSRGLASADSVGDPFLAWLHPELPRQFRDNLVAGERLLLQAVRAEDSARLERAGRLLVQWEQYWREHNVAIAAKANP